MTMTTRAADLKPGQRILTSGGRPATVRAVRPAPLDEGVEVVTEGGGVETASNGYPFNHALEALTHARIDEMIRVVMRADTNTQAHALLVGMLGAHGITVE